MSRYVDIERLVPMQVENSEVELGILVYDYDAVQHEPFIDIVRCGECKYWDDRRKDDWWRKEGACTIISRLGDAIYRNHDDFCSYGEREGERCR